MQNSSGAKKTLLLALLISACCALYAQQPVIKKTTISNFHILQMKTGINLSWLAPGSSKDSHFIIEKSMDGINFREAGLIFTFEPGMPESNYIFPEKIRTDDKRFTSYRLRLVDQKGQSLYSETLTLNKIGS
jgi:hypothetical protein